MEIKTKYNLHDVITVEDWEKELVPCPTCDKTGYVMIKNKKFKCPECHGEKTLEKFVKKPITMEITNIVVNASKCYTDIEYIADWTTWDIEDYHVYKERIYNR